MESFKIKLFEKENPLMKFPSFISLDTEGTARVRQCFSQKLNIDERLDGITLFDLLSEQVEAVKGFNANTDSFDIEEVFRYLDIVPNENISINWQHYDDIDTMSYKDLITYFEYIWFPGPDDIDVFDDTCAWILSINHEGYISFRKF